MLLASDGTRGPRQHLGGREFYLSLIALADVPPVDHEIMLAGRTSMRIKPKENPSKRKGTRSLINRTQMETADLRLSSVKSK